MLNKNVWTKGHSAGLLAFGLWGLFPLYWKLFSELDAVLITAWRLIFTAITLCIIVSFTKQWHELFSYIKNEKKIKPMLLANLLITSNWLIFIWSVAHQATWQSSLGYYISPLITVLLGTLVLKEKLNFNTKLALSLAAMGLIIFLYHTGTVPLISVSLAITFSLYGFIKKGISLPAHLSLTFEVLTTFPFCLLIVFSSPLSAIHGNNPIQLWFLLSLSGILTIIPLFFYNYSAQKIPLNNLGMLQFVSPTLQFLTALFIFHEDINIYKLYSFTCIWFAVLVYLFGPSLWNFFKAKKV